MKFRNLLFLSGLLLISTQVICQEDLKTGLNNSFIQPIVFFGYDFSHLKLLDKKRSADELKDFIPKLSRHLYRAIPPAEFEKLLHENNVTFELSPTYQLNNQIIDSTILTKKRFRLNKDSLQAYISNYTIPDYPGTGFVILYECFQRRSDTTTAYLIFFDISTKNILHTEYIQIHDGNGYGHLADWHHAAFMAAIRLTEAYVWKTDLSQSDPGRYRILTNQDSLPEFKPGFFKNSIDELPVTFGISPAIGISSTLFSAGLHINADIYHILLGFRTTVNPLWSFLSRNSYTETAFYTGYRYRKNRDAVSIGAGIGKMQIDCTSDTYCDDFKEETVRTVPFILEYAYFPRPEVGFAISVNFAFSKRVSITSLLIGVKVGISRKPREIFVK